MIINCRSAISRVWVILRAFLAVCIASGFGFAKTVSMQLFVRMVFLSFLVAVPLESVVAAGASYVYDELGRLIQVVRALFGRGKRFLE